MRLSEWRKRAPYRDSTSPKVLTVVETALGALGAPGDPDCWVVWGDDPGARYIVLVPTASGLIQVNVRVNVPGEGPRAAGKLLRWTRVQLGELAVEIQGGHRLVTFQVESLVLNGVDDVADGISALALSLFEAVDGRPLPSFDGAKSPTARARAGAKSATKTGSRAATKATSRTAATRVAGSNRSAR